MPRVELTRALIGSLECPSEVLKADFFDTKQTGFLLEVRRSGGKTFYQRYTDRHGRVRQFKLGSAEFLNLAAARRLGKSIVAESIISTDPSVRRAEQRKVPTLKEFVANRFLPHVMSTKRSWKTDETLLRVHVLPRLAKKALDEITVEDIARLLTDLREQGYAPNGTANRLVIIIRHLYNLAAKWHVPGCERNPTKGISLAPEVSRERFLSLEEVTRLVRSIEEDENTLAACAIKLLLLTGARRNEITQSKWEWVDWKHEIITVPLTKSGKPRTITLNAAAVSLLASLPTRHSAYIFPSPVTGRPCPSLHFPWERIKKRAGLPDLRLHDLRHSFASFLVNNGATLYSVQRLLGHSTPRYSQRYAHLTSDTLRAAAEHAACVVEGASRS